MSVEGCGCPPDECRSVGAEGCYFGFAPADDVFTALESTPGLLADEEALVEWLQEHGTCEHDPISVDLGPCPSCLAKSLLRSGWLATYVRQQARYENLPLTGVGVTECTCGHYYEEHGPEGCAPDCGCDEPGPDLPVGVNGEGSRLSSHGADDAPDEPKGRCSRNDPAPTGTHECVFVEEREPSGRLVLPPCLVCGFTAMDALDRLRGEVS